MLSRMAPLSLMTVILIPGVFSTAAHAQVHPDIESPRLRELAAKLEAGNDRALDAFWTAIETKTSPLVEPIDGDANHVWLTVFWRGDANTKNVLLVGGLARGYPLDNTLQRLLDTDVWYITYRTRTDLRATYRLSPNDPLVMVPMNDVEANQKQEENYRLDPLNPNKEFGASLIELADAPEQPWIELNHDVPRGELKSEAAFKSEVLNNERRVSVYLPPGYDSGGPAYPMLLTFDQETYTTQVPTPRILNNLIYARRIPPVVAVLVGNAPGARNDELPCNDAFATFLADELIPWVRRNYNVSTDPAKNVIAGSSFGGLASSFFAFRHPELFGNVISQSGSYWWSPETNTIFLTPEVEGEWLTRQYAAAEKKPIRFFLEVGLNEPGDPSMVIVNRHFRDVLIAKGYEIVKYNEYNGGHEPLSWRGSFAAALIALIGK